MRWARRVGRLLLLLGILMLILWGARVGQVALSLREHLGELRSLAEADEGGDLPAVCGLVGDLRNDVAALQRNAGLLIRLAPALGWLPNVGGNLRAAPHLLGVADGLSEAGRLVCSALGPAWEAGQPSLEGLAQALERGQPELQRALTAMGRSQEAWTRVELPALSPSVAHTLAPLSEALPLLQHGLEVALAAPTLLGLEEPQTYLILAQNEDELRPTGGFIGTAGVVTLENGQPVGMRFLDSYAVDDVRHQPYPDPPAPLFDTMALELWLFRDANWSPDFPTSAQQAAAFYEYGQGVQVDGVIAITQRTLELFLAGLGELHIPDLDGAVTEDNVRQFMRAAWDPGDETTREWLRGRKEFVEQIALAIRERIEQHPERIHWPRLARALYQALAGRQLLVAVQDPQAAAALARAGWDGALREYDGDTLLVVDSNLGYNKANRLIDQQLDYRVLLYADGTAAAELALTYQHEGTREGILCQHYLPASGTPTYDLLTHACYYDYLRLYVPAGSVLRGATPHPTPGEYLVRGEPEDGRAVPLDEELGRSVFAQFFVVEYGDVLTTRFWYDLPQVARQQEGRWRYSLLIQKQPGTPSAPISVTVALPTGSHLLSAWPAPRDIDGETLLFELALDRDIQIEVVYE